MNSARIGHSATLLANGQVLVAGGDGRTPSTAELYNPVSGKWSFTGSMTVARAGQSAVLLHNGEVLVAGGDGKTPSTAELYNLVSGTWTATSSLGSGAFGRSTILLQNGLVLALTHTGINPAAELYNPSTGAWSSTAFPMIPGGYLGLLPSGEVWNQGTLYDPTTGQWTLDGGAAPCKGCAVIMLANGNVLAAGGSETLPGKPYPKTVAVETAWLWDLAVGEQLGCTCLSWQRTGSLTTPTYAPTMVLLSNGQALLSGGSTSTSSGPFVAIATAELYTP
jgi:Kelch motif